MGTHSTASEAQLFMGASTASTLPAPGSDTFTKVAKLKTLTVPKVSKGTQKENTLDGETISSSGTAQWSNCTGSFATDYANTQHTNMLADAAVSGRKRNWYTIEPDEGGRRTDFIGEVVRCEGTPYQASLDGAPAHTHEFEIATSGVPAVTP